MATDLQPYRWFIGVLADGTYRFIPPTMLADAEKYIGKHGGGVYTHAGFLVFAANGSWFRWLNKEFEEKNRGVPEGAKTTPHIDVPNIECTFSDSALKWLEENEDELKAIGGKYYDFIPRH